MPPLYDDVGGPRVFNEIAREFFIRVAHDRLLAPLYADEMRPLVQDRLAAFLAQYWGGPRRYAELRGAPRLVMRHAHLAITPAHRAAWLDAMRGALEMVELGEEARERIWAHLVASADLLVDRARPGGSSAL